MTSNRRGKKEALDAIKAKASEGHFVHINAVTEWGHGAPISVTKVGCRINSP